MMKAILSVLIAVLPILSCQQDEDWGFERGGTSGKDRERSSSGDARFGNGNINGVDFAAEGEGEIEYPQLVFRGTGILVSIDNNPIKASTRQLLSRESIITETTEFSSSDSQINPRVKKLVGTSITFNRPSKVELANRVRDDGFLRHSFLMYANSTASTAGKALTVVFKTPVPVIAIPTEMVNYDALKTGPVTYTTEVHVSDGKRFNLDVSITELSRTGSQIVIEQITSIPNDTNGVLYDRLEIPYEQVFTIDTATKKLIAHRTRDYYYNSEKGKRQLWIDFNLCEYTLGGQTERLSCPY